jgi:hypothetical protein
MCLFEWMPRLRLGMEEQYSLALIDNLLLLKPEVSEIIRGYRIAHPKYYKMFIIERHHVE